MELSVKDHLFTLAPRSTLFVPFELLAVKLVWPAAWPLPPFGPVRHILSAFCFCFQLLFVLLILSHACWRSPSTFWRYLKSRPKIHHHEVIDPHSFLQRFPAACSLCQALLPFEHQPSISFVWQDPASHTKLWPGSSNLAPRSLWPYQKLPKKFNLRLPFLRPNCVPLQSSALSLPLPQNCHEDLSSAASQSLHRLAHSFRRRVRH